MKANWKLENYHSKDPFKVPEGYFESLTSRVMDNLPETKVHVLQPRNRGNRALLYIAAAFIGVLLCCGSIFTLSNIPESDLALQDSIYMEEMMDYTMMNDMVLHQYLTEAYYGE